MARTYKEILAKIRPIQQQAPKRFMRFYDQVFLLLQAIPPGKSILVREHCTERSLELFLDVAEMVIIEDHIHTPAIKGWLDFNEDKSEILRESDCTPSHARRHSYTDKIFNNDK